MHKKLTCWDRVPILQQMLVGCCVFGNKSVVVNKIKQAATVENTKHKQMKKNIFIDLLQFSLLLLTFDYGCICRQTRLQLAYQSV